MRKYFVALALTMFIIMMFLTSTVFASWPIATKILYNGNIFTSNPYADPNTAFVEALAICHNVIVASGTNEEAFEWQGWFTQLIDLEGRTGIPTWNDSHCHTLPFLFQGGYIQDPYEWLPGPGPSVVEAYNMIAYANLVLPLGEFIHLIVGDLYIDEGGIDRHTLDTIAPNRGVIIYGCGGHFCEINSTSMYAAGLHPYVEDLDWGQYGRYTEGPYEGEFDGELIEYAAWDFVKRLRSQQSDEEIAEIMQSYFDYALSLGIGTLQDISFIEPHRNAAIVKSLNHSIRYRNIGVFYDLNELRTSFDGMGPVNPWERVYTAGWKGIPDGLFQERRAYLSEDYTDKPGYRGMFPFGSDFSAILGANFGSPWFKRNQPIFHMVGDAAIQELITTMNTTNICNTWPLRRVRIEHGYLIRPDQIPELAELNVVCTVMPSQFIFGAQTFPRIGPERFSYAYPLKSLVDAGVHVSLGSEAIGGIGNPYLTCLLAMMHPANPSEAIDLGTAVIAHTLGSAYAEFSEFYKGALLFGYFADLVILDRNIFDPAVIPTIADTVSVLTMINGEVVYGGL